MIGRAVDAESLAGQAVDIAPFGEIRFWTGADALSIEGHLLKGQQGVYHPVDVPEQGGPHLGIEWSIPRQFREVRVHYAIPPADPARVRLQYWNHNWPARWFGGWTAIDDPHNGRWVTAHGEVTANGRTAIYRFDPLDITELERAEDFAVPWRQSYRLRLLFPRGPLAAVERLEVLSTSTWRTETLRVQADDPAWLDAEISVRNGYALRSRAQGGALELMLLAADCGNQADPKLLPEPPDRTVVTLNGSCGRVSFAVDDATGGGMVVIPHLGLRIHSADQAEPGIRRELPKPVHRLVFDEPEQTLERARREIPELVKTRQGRYVPLGCEGNRLEAALRYNGDLFLDKRQMKVTGRDTARLLWPGSRIEYRFPTMDPPDFREREDAVEQSAMNGYLPVYTSRWVDRYVEFEKTDFAALLMEGPENAERKRGDEPVCVFSRVKVRNISEETLTALFWMVIESPEALEIRDGFVYATARIREERWPWHREALERRWTVQPYDVARLRAQILLNGGGTLRAAACPRDPHRFAGIPDAVLVEVPLGPRAQHTFDIKIPLVTFTGEEGTAEVAAADFDSKLAEMAAYWEEKISSGARIDVPDALVNDFVKATIPHIAITADRDIASGHWLLPAATYTYNVCANEAMHQVRSLDMRGYHAEARRYLMPFVHCQGSRPLHGKFRSQEGVLHGLRVSEDHDYQTFNYNLDHGFVLFALAEHYLLTRDRRWARTIAGNLAAACDFVTRERQYTMKRDAAGSPVPEYGLLPPGHLEDNPEWLYWYAVNAYCYRGMEAAAVALREIGHPEGDRVAADAAAYREDLRRSLRLHMELSPVVRLLDGTFVPFTPTRAGLLSRDLGWIRDSLYGPIHAIECGVLEPLEPQSTWILEDSEDNVFISKLRGRQVDIRRFWFSHGGNTIQSGLLPMAMVYVKRDEPRHAVRCLLNAFAQNIYEDVRCFTEHPVDAFGLGRGPFYKTPDECCWVNWLRHCLLSEIGYDTLRLAPAVPLEWMTDGRTVEAARMPTYFGPVSLKIESRLSCGEIRALIAPPKRNPPARLEIRLRHPEGRSIRRVEVEGGRASLVDRQRSLIRLEPGRARRITVTARF